MFHVNHELRDVLLNASMVNPRPYVLQILPSIFSATADSMQQPTALSVATSLAINGRELFTAEADRWLQWNVNYGTTISSGVGEYAWFNTHPESFNNLAARPFACRLLAAAVVAGLCKVVFKLLPSLVFGALCKAGVTKVAKVQQKDCFGRDVPQSKAYVVEIPVR